MRQHRLPVTAVALAAVVVGSVAAAGPSQAGLVTSCTGTAADLTVPGDLFVPAGQSCELTNVIINGSATVRANANLLLTGSTVNGPLTVQANGFFSAERSTLTGAARFNAAFGGFVEGGTVGGNVIVTGPGFFYSVRTVHQGGIASTGGETYLESGRVARAISTTGDLLTDLYDTVVQGTVTVDAASLGSVVCASEIDGAASFTGGGTVQLGGDTPVDGCGFDVFAAGVTAAGNSDVHVVGTVVRGALDCAGNATAPDGADNRLRGGATGQCADLAPPTGATGTAGTAARKDGISTRIASRTSAGKQSARKAGQALAGG
jgi:hypothetical protein